MSWTQSYHALEALIKTRQQFEKEHPVEPYTTFPTDINFTNINGYSLLQLACKIGDFNKVKECVDKGADLDYVNRYSRDSAAIVLALKHGHLKIAKFLFSLGASCINVSPYHCSNVESKAWVTEIIQEALQTSFPDPADCIVNGKIHQIFDHTTINSSLQRASEIGDINFLRIAMTGKFALAIKFALEGFGIDESLIVIAAKNNQLKTLEFFVSTGASIDSDFSYTKTALMTAIERKYETITYYLLTHVKNINQQCHRKFNALTYAVYAENKLLIESLIAKGANINNADINNQTIVHAAVETQNIDIVQQILDINGIEKITNNDNMYGFSPLEIAIQKKQAAIGIVQQHRLTEIINLIAKKLHIDSYTLEQLLNKKYSLLTSMGRNLDKFRYYLRSRYRDGDFLKGGQCSGFSFFQAWFASRGKKNYYLMTSDLISKWNGDEVTLLQPLSMPQGKYYPNLESLLERWINIIHWFQSGLGVYQQHQRSKQFQLIKKIKMPEYLLIYDDITATKKTIEQLQEIYLYLNRMPINTQFEINGDNHIASGFINIQSEFEYDDCNFDYPSNQTSDINEQIRRFIDFMYINHNRFANSVNFRLHMFYFGKDQFLEQYKNFEIFKEEEYPKDQQEADDFQKKSPNRYTHLHIAVIARSLTSLKQLLAANHCDKYATDIQGRLAWSIALNNDFSEALHLLLDYAKITDVELQISYAMNPKLTREIIDKINLTTIDQWWYRATWNKDVDLMIQLVTKYKINVNTLIFGTLPLVMALKSDTPSLVLFLIEQGASIFKMDYSKSSPLKLAMMENRHTDLILNRLIDINQKDDAGFSAMDYAASCLNLTLMQELMKRGVIIQQEDGLKILIMIENLSSDDESKKRQCKDLIAINYTMQSLLACYAQLNTNEFKLLVTQCAPEILNQKLDNGSTLLAHTVRFGHRDNIKALLEVGYDINAMELLGNTALMKYILSSKINYPIISILLDYHAATDIKNNDGKTAIDLVRESNDKKLQQIFIDHGYTLEAPIMQSEYVVKMCSH